ncbi:MAG: hypothetical protein GY946_00155 [bacterium]|nr:hypothetical protein [bacterium]
MFTETPGQELALADAICQQEADIVGLPGTFVALLTTSLGAAHTRLGAAQGWRDPNGRPIANTPEDIASYRWLGYVEVSPSGVRSDWQFWGGGDGTADQTCQGWTSSDSLDSGKDMTFRLFSPEESTRTCDTPMPLACASIDYVDPIVVTPPNPHRLAFLSASPVVAGSNVTIMDGLCQLDFQNTFGPDTGRTFAALVAPALGTTPASRLAGLPDVPWIRADGVIIADTTTAFLDSDWHTFLQIRPDGTFFGEYTGETVIGGNGDLRSAATNATSCDGWTRTDSGQTFRPGKVGRWPAKTYYNARSCDSWLNVFLYCVETTP